MRHIEKIQNEIRQHVLDRALRGRGKNRVERVVGHYRPRVHFSNNGKPLCQQYSVYELSQTQEPGEVTCAYCKKRVDATST